MDRLNISLPPTLMGTEAEQLVQMHRFLFRLSEEISRALDMQEIALQEDAAKQIEVSQQAANKELITQQTALKSLIIKTADVVKTEMDTLETTLRQLYIAKSEWGSYEENIKNDMVATAQGVVQSFDFESRLQAAEAGISMLKLMHHWYWGRAKIGDYKVISSGYIQSGIIGEDDDGFPIIGVAIGQDLKSTVIDGQTYIDMTRNLATYTPDCITFWQNGVEAMHINSGEMSIASARIFRRLTVGDEWEVSRKHGFTVKWIGGEA